MVLAPRCHENNLHMASAHKPQFPDMCTHSGMNTTIHIAQISRNEAINVRTRASSAASTTLKERAAKPTRVYGLRLVKAAASWASCTCLEYPELGGSVANGGKRAAGSAATRPS